MVDIGKIIAYESDELEYDDVIAMFQEMIDDGSVWQLQGSYGRTAHSLIQSGLCKASKEARKLWEGRARG